MQWSKINRNTLPLAVVNLSLGISFAYALYTRGRVSGLTARRCCPISKTRHNAGRQRAHPRKSADALEFSRDSAHEASIASKLFGQTEESTAAAA